MFELLSPPGILTLPYVQEAEKKEFFIGGLQFEAQQQARAVRQEPKMQGGSSCGIIKSLCIAVAHTPPPISYRSEKKEVSSCAEAIAIPAV